jgi:hypothetical protein
MKSTFTQQPIIPMGWTGDLKHFNKWIKSLTKEVDKVRNTNVSQKLRG